MDSPSNMIRITCNSDMHLKNFSLYAPDGQHILSPAYDMINTLIVMPEDTEELALSLTVDNARSHGAILCNP